MMIELCQFAIFKSFLHIHFLETILMLCQFVHLPIIFPYSFPENFCQFRFSLESTIAQNVDKINQVLAGLAKWGVGGVWNCEFRILIQKKMKKRECTLHTDKCENHVFTLPVLFPCSQSCLDCRSKLSELSRKWWSCHTVELPSKEEPP